MTKSGYQDKVIKNLLAITLYVPLIIAIIASSMKLYDFIYPATEGNNVYEQASNLRYDLTNRLLFIDTLEPDLEINFSTLLYRQIISST